MNTHNHEGDRLTIGCPECINTRDFAELEQIVRHRADNDPDCADNLAALVALCDESTTFHLGVLRTRHLWPHHLATHIPLVVTFGNHDRGDQ